MRQSPVRRRRGAEKFQKAGAVATASDRCQYTHEGEADEIYTEAIHKLFVTESDFRTLLGARGIYDSLEACCDLCEHAADIIEQVVIKNT